MEQPEEIDPQRLINHIIDAATEINVEQQTRRVRHAFSVMLVCDNKKCLAYGDDTPDWCENDPLHRCMMCGTEKVNWREVPVDDLRSDLKRYLTLFSFLDVERAEIYDQKLWLFGELMTVQDFRLCVKQGGFVDDDGYGNPAKRNDDGVMLRSTRRVYPSRLFEIPLDATHIVWYNR